MIPGNNRSGGVRVTVCMANQLLGRGHRVRIALPRPKLLAYAKEHGLLRLVGFRNYSEEVTGWLHDFTGTVERFRQLDDLVFKSGEIVVAVGTFTIRNVYNLRQAVVKVRYNHGLLDNMTDIEREAWKLPMPTITVSSTIIPDIERISGQRVFAVVPNGINMEEYRPIAGVKRDGIGSIFSLHPAKAPEIMVQVFNRLRDVFPEIPRYAFGTDRCPAELAATAYWRYPSVEKTRLIYNQAKIWLVVSHTEGFSQPVLEAMACGCVVISTDSYGGRELILNGENGLLVPRGSTDGFLHAITGVLKDPEVERKLAKGGVDSARKHSWERAADKMEAALQQLSFR